MVKEEQSKGLSYSDIDRLSEARVYSIEVETGHAFKNMSLDQVKRDGQELIELGKSILANADKGFVKSKDPDEKEFVGKLFGFKQ